MLLSIVHTYTVLYSKRVRQKDKKWEDGKLRFYEFNNKFEVISEDGMLVAADFYPSEKKFNKDGKPPFEIGSSFVFPNGNLIVEFDDYVGVTNRDVTGAFTKSPLRTKLVIQSPNMPSLNPSEVISRLKIVNSPVGSHVNTSILSKCKLKMEESSQLEPIQLKPGQPESRKPETSLPVSSKPNTSQAVSSEPKIRTLTPLKFEHGPEIYKFANLYKWESRVRRFTRRIAPGSGRVSKLNSHSR